MRTDKRLLAFTLLVLLVGGVAAFAAPPLIPRAIIFGNPEKAMPEISPDATRLAYLAPSAKDVLNVWVRTLGKEDDTQVTNDTYRGIRDYKWDEDGKHILYLQDLNGDENWHLYLADLETKVVRDLTPFQGIRADGLITDKHHPHEVLIGLNLRDRRVFDMFRVNLTTGALVLDTLNPGDVLQWVADPSFRLRAAWAEDPATANQTLRVRQSQDAPWRKLLTLPFGENGGMWPYGSTNFAGDGQAIYVTSSLGANTSRLVKISVATGKELKTVAANPKVDVGEVLIHPDTKIVQAVGFNYLKNEWTVLDPKIKADFEKLAQLHRGEFSISSRDRADRNWVVTYSSDDGPIAYYLYRRDHQTGELLFVNRPKLNEYTLAPMQPVVLKARDGLELVGYLTLPTGVEPKNLPLVLGVHGGPWAIRDTWGYDPIAQWFANRGYANLKVNYRGSAGFGKDFHNAGNGEWGTGKMQHDLSDAVQWAIQQGIADPKKVCIFGGSYGGYATLAGLVFTPELYRCGVDIVGPSNIRTLFQAVPPYWEPFKKELILRVGDAEKDEALNQRISPLFHAADAKAPLLIGQGANDPRVNIRESDQMVEAMRAKGLPVTYVVYTDEGHGFARPENRLDFYGRVDEFLSKQLGGRFEPWAEVKGSTASVR
jgi:dipeptidyl aminopeptidase/acylaminoacyl peptidase